MKYIFNLNSSVLVFLTIGLFCPHNLVQSQGVNCGQNCGIAPCQNCQTNPIIPCPTANCAQQTINLPCNNQNCQLTTQISPPCQNCQTVLPTPCAVGSCMPQNIPSSIQNCQPCQNIQPAPVIQPVKQEPVYKYERIQEPSDSHNIINTSSPTNITNHISKTSNIHNTNIINNPITHHITNENRVTYVNGQKVETKLENIATEKKSTPITYEEDIEEPEKEKCCTVVSPRMCRRTQNKWKCYHKKYDRCGSMCTSDTIHLRPRNTYYRKPVLIVPPSVRVNANTCDNNNLECSGCGHNGRSCSDGCSCYDCDSSNGDCDYVPLDDYCNVHGYDHECRYQTF